MQQLFLEQNNKLLYGDLSMSFDQWVKKLHNNYITVQFKLMYQFRRKCINVITRVPIL